MHKSPHVQVVMDFRKLRVGVADEKVSVVLPSRSLLVMTGESRYMWTHAIPTRLFDTISTPHQGYTALARGTRLSLTFRAVRQPPCVCRCGELPWQHCIDPRHFIFRVPPALRLSASKFDLLMRFTIMLIT